MDVVECADRKGFLCRSKIDSLSAIEMKRLQHAGQSISESVTRIVQVGSIDDDVTDGQRKSGRVWCDSEKGLDLGASQGFLLNKLLC